MNLGATITQTLYLADKALKWFPDVDIIILKATATERKQ
jgi:hypothetical protein